MTAAATSVWRLDPAITFLNHGSFGSCPTPVLEAQQALRDRLERRPVHFMTRELEPLLDGVRTALARFVHAESEGFALVPNATTGVNTVLQSVALQPGDEILVTDHVYGACRNAAEVVAARRGARLVVARVPFPISAPQQVTDAILAAVGRRTRLALIDHVTSPTGLVWPVQEIVRALEARGVDTLVDGAHAPGMLDVDLEAIGAAYYTANCHKWMCAPKGAAFLWVRADRRAGLHPLVTSHGLTSPRQDRSRFLLEFDWVGTVDPTPWLATPVALETVGSLVPGGWPEVRRRNHELALTARRIVCDALAIDPPAPESMIGALVAVPLPPRARDEGLSPAWLDGLQRELYEEYAIEVPIFPWPTPPARLVRISAQLYNEPAHYEHLARSLRTLL